MSVNRSTQDERLVCIAQLFAGRKFVECLQILEASKPNTDIFLTILEASCLVHLGIYQDQAFQMLKDAFAGKKETWPQFEYGLSFYINGDSEDLQVFLKLDEKEMLQIPGGSIISEHLKQGKPLLQ